MPRPPADRPTDAELDILTILWDQGPSELGAVHAALSQHRKVALTTVATMLTLMLGKRLVSRRKGKRNYLWSARVSRDAAAQGMVRRLLDRVFDGSAHQLVAHLLEHEQLSDADRSEIAALLASARKSRRTSSDQGERP
jgi:predicted transcriptional regulator